MKNKHILISGAGIAGLTLAHCLKQYGFVPTLIEHFPVLRTGGYKIDIRGAAIEVIKRMGIYPSIVESVTDIQTAIFVDGSGNHITTMSADLCGTRIKGDLEIIRGDLCEIIFKQIPDVECLFGDSIRNVSEDTDGVLVEFEQNKSRRFDLVIGGDGLHSIVRNLVFGNESQFLQKLDLFISVFTIPNFLRLDRSEIEYHDIQKFVNVYSAHNDPHAKAGFAFSSESLEFDLHNIEQQKQLLQNTFKEAGWEVPRLLSFMKEASDFYFDSIAQIHMSHWSKGRVALIGDAGYAASPLSGQGTSLALVGAYVLANELKRAQGDYIEAFSQYEKTMHTFVKKNQRLANLSVEIMKKKKNSLHDFLLRLLPEKWILFLKKLSLRRTTKAANAISLRKYH